jgi:hypothetical protein
MANAEQAAAAVEKFNGVALNGRAMRVDAASEKSGSGPRSDGFRGGAGGGFPSRPHSRPKGSRRNLRARKRSL